ncbi:MULTISPECIES: cupin domain-containing protein [Chryseobacterium]|uniref:cupin domain-containing protein n=1 Tax=Chryseobacterium TaxID=59732 RepID=UPI000678A463|nr:MULTISPECIES: cupin domain-containing protein [Chryseobacterium]
MERRKFIKSGTLAIAGLLLHTRVSAMTTVTPQIFYFKDDGSIPNSKFPLLIYKNAFSQRGSKGGDWLEERFATNGWTNTWRWGIYPFHHYHSNTHEVLGVFSGGALLQMGGEKGEKIQVKAGDILIIPAGVGHKCITHSDDFTVLGAYPSGLSPDLMKGEKSERPAADQRIAKVKLPSADPLTGKNSGLIKIWSK